MCVYGCCGSGFSNFQRNQLATKGDFWDVCVCVCSPGWVECMLKWKVVNWTFFLCVLPSLSPFGNSGFGFYIFVGNLYFVCVQHFLQLLLPQLRLLFHFSFHFHFTAIHACVYVLPNPGIRILDLCAEFWLWVPGWGHLLFIALQITVESHKTCKTIYSNKY